MKTNGTKIRRTMLAMTLLFAACAGDDGNFSDPVKKPEQQVVDGYVNVAINMPTSLESTRADNYDDGESNEYQVNEALIVFFGGIEEANATFLKAYSLDVSGWTADPDNEQITQTASYVMEAPAVPNGVSLYALAVVNANGILTVGGDGVLMRDGVPVFGEGHDTIEALRTEVEKNVTAFISTSGNENSSFFMTNAPLSDKSGSDSQRSSAEASTLVKVKVYDTEEAASAEEADPIFVERLVGKVSMSIARGITAGDSGNTVEVENPGSIYDGDRVDLKGWVLNVTNKSTRLVRDVGGLSKWVQYDSGDSRFLAGSAVKSGVSRYRIFWAEDCNYSDSDGHGKSDFNMYDNTTEPSSIDWNTSWEEKTNVAYCLENTFDTKHQVKNETTSVLIKGQYHRSEDAAVKSFFTMKNNGELLSEEEFVRKVKAVVPELEGSEVQVNPDAVGGYYNTNDRKLSTLLTVVGTGADALTKVVSELGTVKYYKNGETYYCTALIRHFDEFETPWANGDSYDEAKHLGRYGVVRNTWYQLTIDRISGPGEPEIPDVPDEPDDTTEGYIKISVNVLSWALRKQGVDL